MQLSSALLFLCGLAGAAADAAGTPGARQVRIDTHAQAENHQEGLPAQEYEATLRSEPEPHAGPVIRTQQQKSSALESHVHVAVSPLRTAVVNAAGEATVEDSDPISEEHQHADLSTQMIADLKADQAKAQKLEQAAPAKLEESASKRDTPATTSGRQSSIQDTLTVNYDRPWNERFRASVFGLQAAIVIIVLGALAYQVICHRMASGLDSLGPPKKTTLPLPGVLSENYLETLCARFGKLRDVFTMFLGRFKVAEKLKEEAVDEQCTKVPVVVRAGVGQPNAPKSNKEPSAPPPSFYARKGKYDCMDELLQNIKSEIDTQEDQDPETAEKLQSPFGAADEAAETEPALDESMMPEEAPEPPVKPPEPVLDESLLPQGLDASAPVSAYY